MITYIKLILQIVAIICFSGLSVIGLIQKDWNMGVVVNILLAVFYIFLYFQPIK